MFAFESDRIDCSKSAAALCRQAEQNILAPLVNAAWIEPCNTATSTLDKLTGKVQSHQLKPLSVDKCQPYSGLFWLQTVSAALGSVVPYALAGKFAGGALRAYKVSGSESAAQIVGAVVYDGLRSLRPGETQWGNAAGSAIAFGIYEGGNRLTSAAPLLTRLAVRPLVGAAGSTAQLTIARAGDWQNGSTPKVDEFVLAAITGATFSSALPYAQEALRRAEDRANLALALGIPAERHIKISNRPEQVGTLRFELEPLLAKNRWARVQTNADQTAYRADRDLITLKSGANDLELLVHELTHRAEAKEKIAEPAFKLAAQQLASGDDVKAWQIYRSVRAAQETRARLSEQRAAAALDPSQHVFSAGEIAAAVPELALPNGMTYEQTWRSEFVNFKLSGGSYRPGIDYSDAVAGKFLWQERARLLNNAAKGKEEIASLMKTLETRSDLALTGKAEIYRSINTLIEEAPPAYSVKLATDVLKLVADPQEVSQGKHPTCGPAALEFVTYRNSPLSAVRLVSQVARFGSYITGDGTEIRLSRLDLKPELSLWERPNFASQLFQTTAINCHWQRQDRFMRWLDYETFVYKQSYKGFLRYERQSTCDLNESPYRLIDYDSRPAQPIVRSSYDIKNFDPADPFINSAALSDIYHQIVGHQRPEVLLPDSFANIEDLSHQLVAAKANRNLPMIIGIDVSRKPFRAELETPEVASGHFIVVRNFNQLTGHVDIFNPWGRQYQPEGLSLQQLWHATFPLNPRVCNS